MADPNEHTQTTRNHPRDWVDYGALLISFVTLIVLAFTLRAVDRYTREAHRQNGLLRVTLEVQTRPNIGMAVDGRGRPIVPTIGAKITFHITAFNFGRRPGRAHFRASAVYSLDRLPTIELPSSEVADEIVWPPFETGLDITTRDPVTEGQLADMKAGQGRFYIRVLATYGIYQTGICTCLSLKPGNPAPLAPVEVEEPASPCSDKKSSCVDQDCK